MNLHQEVIDARKRYEDIIEIHEKIAGMFPDEALGSYANLFSAALDYGEITRDEYDRAKIYYGKLWNYAGD